MSEKPLPFVITDRRKFSSDGEPRPNTEPEPEREPRREQPSEAVPGPGGPRSVTEMPYPAQDSDAYAAAGDDTAGGDLPPAPTAEQMEQSRVAFHATAERLDLAVRAANPGAEHPPAMSFEQLIQSVYMQAILQLGGGTQPGQQPQVDLLGARQSIDMLGVLDEKTAGNLSEAEHTLLISALFELRLAFLEITQAIARSAQQQRGPGGLGGGPAGVGRPGPSIVR